MTGGPLNISPYLKGTEYELRHPRSNEFIGLVNNLTDARLFAQAEPMHRILTELVAEARAAGWQFTGLAQAERVLGSVPVEE